MPRTGSPAVGQICHYPCRDGGRRAVRARSSRRADPAGAVRDGRRGAGGDLPPPAPGPRPACPRGRVPAAGGLPVRRAGIPAGLGRAHGRPGRAAVPGPGRVRDDPGPPPPRSRAAARAVLPAARPVPGGHAMAGAAIPRCGCWPWPPAGPAPSSTPCSARRRSARPLTRPPTWN
jgi:hypothetical protein